MSGKNSEIKFEKMKKAENELTRSMSAVSIEDQR
jgi:hypothetical protein